MRNNLSQISIISSLLAICILISSVFSGALAEGKGGSESKQATQTEVNEGIKEAKKIISDLTKKVYSKSLFSPKDNSKLIELKLKLYNLWEKNPTNRDLAEPLYNTAILLKDRELYDDAIEILNVVVESFPPPEDIDEESEPTVDYSSKAEKLITKIKKEHPSE